MEQQQMQPTQGKRKLNAFMMVVGIAVAVILIFSVLTVMFYRQAADFRESKYKAQYVLVDEIVTSIPLATDAISEVLRDSK
jgi:heme/copper-type cytochrome/quinol oxidase subunit 2